MEALRLALFPLLWATLVSAAPQQPRAEKCPSVRELRDPVSGKCFVSGDQDNNACTGLNMALVVPPDSNVDDVVYGACECNPRQECGPRLLYWPQTDSCYEHRSQVGPTCSSSL